MKRPSYKKAVEHVALNDDPVELDPEVVAGTISVGLVADLFGVDVDVVAADVVRLRIRVGSSPPCATPLLRTGESS
jgi:hypothetical protein